MKGNRAEQSERLNLLVVGKAMTNDELNERWRDAIARMIHDASTTMDADAFWLWHDAKMSALVHDGVRDEFMEVTELVVTNSYW